MIPRLHGNAWKQNKMSKSRSMGSYGNSRVAWMLGLDLSLPSILLEGKNHGGTDTWDNDNLDLLNLGQ